MEYDFQRYLAAKRSVDRAALNQNVWAQLSSSFGRMRSPRRVLDIGCGTGAMAAALYNQLLGEEDAYTGLDADAQNIAAARAGVWDGSPKFVCADFFDFEPDGAFDLVVASSFLDLVSLTHALDRIFRFLRPGGLACFTFNFDGVTLFEPAHPLDEPVLHAYHASMDHRPGGGDSRTGRKLFSALPAAGFDLLIAGSSDWIVHPDRNGVYPADEAYFLAHILHFFETSCAGTPGLDAWLAARRAHLEARKLIFIAHQYDFLARRPVE